MYILSHVSAAAIQYLSRGPSEHVNIPQSAPTVTAEQLDNVPGDVKSRLVLVKFSGTVCISNTVPLSLQ